MSSPTLYGKFTLKHRNDCSVKTITIILFTLLCCGCNNSKYSEEIVCSSEGNKHPNGNNKFCLFGCCCSSVRIFWRLHQKLMPFILIWFLFFYFVRFCFQCATIIIIRVNVIYLHQTESICLTRSGYEKKKNTRVLHWDVMNEGDTETLVAFSKHFSVN